MQGRSIKWDDYEKRVKIVLVTQYMNVCEW